MAKQYRRSKRPNRPNRPQDQRAGISVAQQLKSVDAKVSSGVFVFGGPLSVKEFMEKIGRSPAELIKMYFMKGKIMTINSMLNEEQIGELCLEYGLDFQVENVVTKENVLDKMVFDDESKGETRPPVITIMGHVDHGKTTLLDTIRKTHVAKGEAGGITQHIGAYMIKHNGASMTFIDTPGHEAFSKMRARGASTTDIVVLVVAADDGLMPQTEEAIDHAATAKVPVIVFVNKIDKGTGKMEKLMGDLAAKNLVPEEWQGTTPFVKGSALKNIGIEELLDTIATMAEVNEYKANRNRLANGVVLEARLDKGRGPVATLLVQGGTLKRGDVLAAGTTYGRVRSLQSDLGAELSEALPGTPVFVAGLLDVPSAGDRFVALSDEREAKEMANLRKAATRQTGPGGITDEIKAKIESGETKRLDVIVKADAHGSLEAILGTLAGLEVEGSAVQVIRGAVGPVTMTDVELATPTKALILAFNVRTPPMLVQDAERAGVVIASHSIIYKLKDYLLELLQGQRVKQYEEKPLGKAEVLQLWSHTEVGQISGSRVLSGSISRGSKAKLLRAGETIYTGEIKSLRQLKETVKEVTAGKECGIVLSNFAAAQVGDTIETFEMVEKK